MKKSSGHPVSRRTFLATSVLAAAALALDWSALEALADKIGPKDQYPVVIIGAGLGGLTAAALLARHGFPVTVLEQHDIPGGYATSFDRAGGKFTFEVSLHTTAARGGATEQILKATGVFDQVEAVKLPDQCRVITPDYDLTYPQTDPEGLIRLLAARFPEEEAGIRDCINRILAVVEESERPFDRDSFFQKLKFPSSHPAMWAIRNQTLAQFLDKYLKSPKLKYLLSIYTNYYGLPPSHLSAFFYAVASGGYIKHGAYHYKPRSQRLSNALADVIRKNGGRVILETEATEIFLQDDAVAGVIAGNGLKYPAKAVLSNASAPTTMEKLLPQGVVQESYLKKLRSFRPSISYFGVWLGLNTEIRGKVKGTTVFVTDDYDQEKGFQANLAGDLSRSPFGVAIYDNMFPGYSKPGTSTISVGTVCGFEPWKKYEQDYFAGRKEAYNQEKKRLAEILIQRAEAGVVPGLRGMIEVMEAATPLTMMRYTRNPQGAIYGYEQSMDNAYMTRIENATPVKGLYLASAWGNPGGGYTGVQIGGMQAFERLMKDWGVKTAG
ncbi:MAG: NAD(P)/FAD-dependent oxidoreductase [Deltaproteobacteria bacterium]|nr:NAD(P)/FAD-dependent oxidoreductase [Deltaproteobacteria bacterium]